jgi:hypothetical protein
MSSASTIKVGVIADQTGPLSFAGLANANVARMVIGEEHATLSETGERVVLIVASGTSRIDNKKVKARFRGTHLPQDLMPLILFSGGYGGLVHSDAACVSFSCCVRRDALAKAAGTTKDRVCVHCLHQHDAPGCDFEADELLKPFKTTEVKQLVKVLTNLSSVSPGSLKSNTSGQVDSSLPPRFPCCLAAKDWQQLVGLLDLRIGCRRL